MGSEWLKVTANEFCYSVRDGTHDSPKPVDLGRPLITSRHITGGRLDLQKAYTISLEDFEAINRRSKVDRWDVLISMIGTVGEICLIREEPNFAIKNVGLFKNKSEFHGKWLYYYLLSPTTQQLIREMSRGTTQQYIPLGALRELPILVPVDKMEQRAIAHILGTLDDKIELNRKCNETLEAMARALFKDWFVDFGPVRAKMEGRDPYLPAEIWDLFPDSLDDEGKPEGWGYRALGDCFSLTMGQSPPGDSYNDIGDGLPFFQGRTDFGFRYPDNRKYCSAPTRIANAEDTLVSVRAPVGDINLAWEKCCIGRGVSAVRHFSGVRSFTYHAIWSLQEELRQYEHTGTVFGAINKKQFQAIEFIEPSMELILNFEKMVSPMDNSIRNNIAESRNLTQLRDTLLPKLISGDIRVKDVDKFMERVLHGTNM